MNANYRILLSASLGFVVGFAFCFCWRVGMPDPELEASSSLSARDVEVVTSPGPAGYAESSNKVLPQVEFLGSRKLSPRTWTMPEGWQVTIWHPTLPPQKAGTVDVAEYVTRTMGLTNR